MYVFCFFHITDSDRQFEDIEAGAYFKKRALILCPVPTVNHGGAEKASAG